VSIEIAPLGPDDREAAASLLASRHAGDRRRAWDLPARYEDTDIALEAIDLLMGSPASAGVIARDGREPAGFLASVMRAPSQLSMGAKFVRSRAAVVPYHGHALADRDDGELYRELYAALSRVWVERGYFSHYVEIPALDYMAAEAFSSLGFGRQTTLAVRRVAESVVDSRAEGVEIRRAGPNDLEPILRLSSLLGQHHAAAPSFLPFLREPDAELEKETRERLNAWDHGFFIALREGAAVGALTLGPSSFAPALATTENALYLFEGVVAPSERRGGVGRALLAAGMRWAEEAGHTQCALHFLSANIAAARFWQSHGFWPVTHTLARHVDERIAWARN